MRAFFLAGTDLLSEKKGKTTGLRVNERPQKDFAAAFHC